MKLLSKKIAALAMSGALLATGAAVTYSVHAESHAARVKSLGLVVDEHPLNRDATISASFAPLVKKVAPCVVKIVTTTRGKESSEANIPDLPDDPFFRQFFGNGLGGPDHQRHRQPGHPAPEHGVGSGVIVTADGYILTNNHVVDDADVVKVSLRDGREFTAKVIGKDPKSDVAVVKIDARGLPFLPMADSEKSEVGDRVLAIGNPFGIGQTVTTGIISAMDRATMGLDYEDFIQTDAAINPGNSGGALIDMDGRLIGINTAIYTRSGGNQGIGFAIPTNLARDVMVSLVEYGKVTRGYLGVMIQDVTPSLAKEFDLHNDHGALIGDVVPNGPAAKAGLKDGDVILKFNNEPVRDSRHLKFEVARVKPGDTVPVELLRNGSMKTMDVKIKELPGSNELAKSGSENENATDTLKGVTVGDLNAQAREQMNIPEGIKGAVVTQVEADSAAAEAGLKTGDVITEINRHAVASADDAVKLTEHAKDKITLLHVWSSNGSHYVVVDESKTS